MKQYSYFPGCSAESTGLGNGLSTEAISEPLGIELIELEDWTCCGSTPYGSLDESESIVIAARNLALAEAKGLDLVTPCSSCYVTLNKANLHLQAHPKMLAQVNEALSVAGLKYNGSVSVRQVVDVLINDVTIDGIVAKAKRKLSGLKVAPYYGCQLVRPDYGYDDMEFPQTLDRLIDGLGAEAVDFPLKARCCGGSLMLSEEDRVLGLTSKLLQNAAENGAQCFITPCPLCQTNLDVFQGKIKSKYKADYNLPVLFVSQLIGLALGIDYDSLGLNTLVVSPRKLLKNLSEVEVGT